MIILAILFCTGLACSAAEDPVPPEPAHDTSEHPCTPQEALCWSNGTLMFSNSTCYTPLQRGPCAADEWFRQDSSLPNQHHGGCFKRPCEEDHVKVDSGSCVKLEDAAKEKCPDDHQGHQDAEGIFHCGAAKDWKDLFAEKSNCTVSGADHDMPGHHPGAPHTPDTREGSRMRFNLPCTQQETLCWSNGTLMFRNGSCYIPLQRGPCATDEWIRQDSSLPNLRHGGCFKRPCPENNVQLSSGHCTRLEDAAREKCAGDHQGHLDAEGILQCGAAKNWKDLFSKMGNCTGAGHDHHDKPGATSHNSTEHHPGGPDISNSTLNAKNCVKNKDGTCKNGTVRLTLMAGIAVACITFLNVIAL